VGKNKLARWTELGGFDNVIQPNIDDVVSKDHPVKGSWKKDIFKNENPVVLELGCGKGEYTIGLATRFPDNNYIGIDIKGARIWRGAKTANEKKITNVAFLRTRIEFINSFFSADEIDEIWITFPDPHPGGRNANKRLTSPRFLNKYRLFLKNKGLIHLKTDNTELYNYTKKIVSYNALEINHITNDLYSEDQDNKSSTFYNKSIPVNSSETKPVSYDILSIETHYEKKFLNDGLKINYLSFKLDKEKYIEDVAWKSQKQ
jgi:tRNA (guanine-N7-)-methyltransferase